MGMRASISALGCKITAHHSRRYNYRRHWHGHMQINMQIRSSTWLFYRTLFMLHFMVSCTSAIATDDHGTSMFSKVIYDTRVEEIRSYTLPPVHSVVNLGIWGWH